MHPARATFQIGTFGYTAPEIHFGQTYGLKLDVWSLGALIHFMLSRKIPFAASADVEVARRIYNETLNLDEIEEFKEVSPEAKDLLHGMLQKEPAKRLSIEQVAAHPWIQDAQKTLETLQNK